MCVSQGIHPYHTHTHTPKYFTDFTTRKGCKTPEIGQKSKGIWNWDLTLPKWFWEGVQNLSFDYKNNFYYTKLLYLLLYPKIITKIITSGILNKKMQWHDYCSSVHWKKQEKYIASQWNRSTFLDTNYQTRHAFSHIIQKATDNNESESVIDGLVVSRSYGVASNHFYPIHWWSLATRLIIK